MVLIFGLIAIVLSLVQAVLMLFRQAALIILAGVLPLAAAGSIAPMTRTWVRKVTAWMLALIFYKPAAAAVYATAFTMIGSGGSPRTVLMGFVMLLLSVLTLPALMKFFTWTTGTIAGSGRRRAAARRRRGRRGRDRVDALLRRRRRAGPGRLPELPARPPARRRRQPAGGPPAAPGQAQAGRERQRPPAAAPRRPAAPGPRLQRQRRRGTVRRGAGATGAHASGRPAARRPVQPGSPGCRRASAAGAAAAAGPAAAAAARCGAQTAAAGAHLATGAMEPEDQP